jgi:hypothetical protein
MAARDGIGPNEGIALFYLCDPRSDLLDHPGAFMTRDHGNEGRNGAQYKGEVRVTETAIDITHQNFTGLWRRQFEFFYGARFTDFPQDCGLYFHSSPPGLLVCGLDH